MKRNYQICEHGVIKSRGDYPHGEASLKDLFLPPKEFEDLWQFVVENQEEQLSAERVFGLSSRGKKDKSKQKTLSEL